MVVSFVERLLNRFDRMQFRSLSFQNDVAKTRGGGDQKGIEHDDGF